MIGYSSTVNRSSRRNMYRSPSKRKQRKIVSTRKKNIIPKSNEKKIKKDKKGYKGFYMFKLYTFPNMRYVYEREERMNKNYHP